MSFSNPVAKSVGADGTAPGRVWESRLLPALITPNSVVGGVLCVPVGRTGTPPPFFLLFCLLVCFMGCGVVRGWVCCKGALGLCGVVDVGDEFVLVLTITAAHVRFLCVAWTL